MSTCRIDNQGRIVVPAKWRMDQGIDAGSELVVLEEDGRLIVQTREQAVREAQEIIRRGARGQSSLVDDLLRDRRREVREEIREAKRRVRRG